MAEQQPYPFKSRFQDLIVRPHRVIYAEVGARVREGRIYTQAEMMDELERGGIKNSSRAIQMRDYITTGRFLAATGVALYFENVETLVGKVTLYYDWSRQGSEEFDHSRELAIQRGEQQLRDARTASASRRAQKS